MNVATTTIKAFGFSDADKKIVAMARFVKSAPRRIGDSLAGEVRRSIKQLPKKTTHQQWERSVEYEVSGRSVEVFYNLSVAKYARMRERGGEIKPFRFWSMSFIGKDGKPAFFKGRGLFVPLRPDVRPRQPNLIFGTDFVIAKRVRQSGTHVMEYAIRRELFSPLSKLRTRLAKRLSIAAQGRDDGGAL